MLLIWAGSSRQSFPALPIHASSSSYELDRRPVGLRNRQASALHNEVRGEIGRLCCEGLEAPGATGDRLRAEVGHRIADYGNAENECSGIEFRAIPTRAPLLSAPSQMCTPAPISSGISRRQFLVAGCPAPFLRDGSAFFDRLGRWFTLIAFGGADPSSLLSGAQKHGMLFVMSSSTNRTLSRSMKPKYCWCAQISTSVGAAIRSLTNSPPGELSEQCWA